MAAHLPAEFENYMKTRLGLAFDNFKHSLDQPPPVSVRYNTRKLQPPDGNCVLWCKDGRYLTERPSFTLDPLFHAGAYYVQEASSMLLEQAIRQSVNLDKSLTVLDLCAAPGGKTTHALSLLSNDSILISNEVIRSRSYALLENIEKWGCDNVIITNNDPSDFERVPDLFDLVLVDAPCSGEGLFRREPVAANQWSTKNVELCSLRQRRIVKNVWPAIKPGGILIYSTCTYNEKENLENLAWLGEQEEMEFIPLFLDIRWGLETIEKGKSIGYQCYPHRVKGEGFFFSAIRKTGERSTRKIISTDRLNYPTVSDLGILREWILEPSAQCFFLHGRQVRMFPMSLRHGLLVALHALRVLVAGTAVGEIMKNKVIPDHALALSVKLQNEGVPRIRLNRGDALDYLRKNPIPLPGKDHGFRLIDFDGLGLGWVNLLPNRVNNLYPSAKRIRMGQGMNVN